MVVLIWSFIVLYAFLFTLSSTPAIQTRLAASVSDVLGRKLGTHVTIGRVDLGLFNRIIVDDLLILDQHHKQMLSVGRMSVKAEWTALLQGRIAISSAQLFGAHASLYRDNEQSPTNFQFVIDSLASKDTTSHTPLNLSINSLIIRHSSISYHQKDAPKQKTFTPKHLNVSNISAHVILKKLTDDSVSVNVKRLAFSEQKGFHLNSLSLIASIGQHQAQLDKLNIHLPNSVITADSLQASYDAERWKETLAYHLKRLSLKVTLSDLACFAPSLGGYNDVVELSTFCNGTFSMIHVPWLIVDSDKQLLTLKGSLQASRLNEEIPVWSANLQNLVIADRAVGILSSEIEGIPEIVTRLGGVALHGSAEGNASGTRKAKATAVLGIGTVELDFQMDHDKTYEGTVKAADLNLQKLLDNESFGMLSTMIHVNGTPKLLTARADISNLDYRQYTYKKIEMNGSLNADNLLTGNPKDFSGKASLTIDDDNIWASIHATLEKQGKPTSIVANGNIKRVAPKDLHLTNMWGEAFFDADFAANLSATSLSDAEGFVKLHNFTMTDSTDMFHINEVLLTSEVDAGTHVVHVDGDMGSIALQGQFDWGTLQQSVFNAIGAKLPTLPGLPKQNRSIHNNFDITLHLTSSEWLQRLFYVPFAIHQPLTLHASVSDTRRKITVRGNIDDFSYDGASYKNAHIWLSSPQDSIRCDISANKLMDDGTAMDLQLAANACDNQLQSVVSWNNHAKGTDFMEGQLNMTMQLYNNEKGASEAHLHFLPSTMMIGPTSWNVLPSDVFYSDKSLVVDGFAIKHDQQHLTINGTASSAAEDTISVDLKEMEVGYVLDLVNFHSVEFDGRATGKAYVTQLFNVPSAWTTLTVDSFCFEGGRMGTLTANAQWNNTLKQIDIDALIADGPSSTTSVKGFVSPVREDIELNIHGQGTYIDFLQTYTKGVMQNISGQAYGEVKLVGPLGGMDLLGSLVVDGKAGVNAIGTTYTLKKAPVSFVHDDILFDNVTVYDKYDNTATLSGGIHHRHLSNMTFDLNVETQKLLAYDFPDFGDELFCGTVITEGKVDMHGRPGEVVINCHATPLKPTVFLYNASSSGTVSSQEYITWRDKSKIDENSGQLPESEPASQSTDVFLNFRVNTTPEATIRLLMDAKTSDYITLNGSGIIQATYHNKGAFNMFGTYRVDNGTYGITIQDIIRKNFRFSEGGTIVFGGNPMNATLNLQAIHTVNGVSLSDLNIGNSFSNNTVRVNCLMNILGQAGSPRVEFDLDLPTVNSEEKQMIRSVIANEQEMNQQVLYLLGIGRFYTQNVNNANNQAYDQTELAMQSFLSGTLSTQINEVISRVVKNDNWNFGANISTGNEGWHNAEYEGIISGRMLNNRLLINGQFGYRDNATSANPSFIGDFDIRYLLLPNGNLALKVYNQTNDRYFTRSSLNTQGIGIIMKRDFDSLGELFFRRKEKK